MLENGFSVRRCFADPDRSRDDLLVNLFGEIFGDLFDNLTAEQGAAVIHRHDDAFESEIGIGAGAADFIEDGDDFRQTFQAEPFALEWNENFIGSSECGGHEDAERWRGIEDAVFKKIVRLKTLKDSAQAGEVVIGAGELDFDAGEIHFGGKKREIFTAGVDEFIADIRLTKQDGIDRGEVWSFDSEAGSAVRLGVEIHEQDSLAAQCEGVREVHGGGGFTDSSFLVSDGDDFHELEGWRETLSFKL